MKNKEKGVKKAVIVKFKGKHTHNSTEYLKTELKHEHRRNGSKESRNLKSAKDVTPNLQSYSQIYSEGKGRTSRLNNILDNNINDDYDSRKDLNYHKEETKDLKEKEPSLKTQKNKKERLVKSQKKTVNFNQKIIKGQKSERNLEKEKKESEASLNARNKKIPEKDNNYLINRSMRSFNKKHILKNSGIDVSDSMEQSINIENGRIDDSKNYDKKNESKPIIKISKKDFDFKPSPEEPFSKKSTQKEKIKEAPKIKSKEEKIIIKPTQLEQNEVNYNYEEKINPKDELIQKKEPDVNEDENHIPIIEIKNNFAQIKKNEFKNNNKEKDETKNEDMSNIYNNNDNTEQNNFNNENNNNKNNNIDINNKEIEKDLTNNIDINKKVSFKPNINHLEINNNFSPEINKKITYKTNLTTFSQEKPKKKEQKAYSNFIQNIKRANKKKKGNNLTNLLRYTEPKQKREDPKAKLSRAIRKLSLLNRTIIHTYKDINRSIDYRKTINNPLTSNIREDIMKTKEEMNHDQRNLSCKNLSSEDVYNRDNYSGIILMKYEEGEKIIELKLDKDIDEINNIFYKENFEINNREVELIYKDELEKIKYENERIEAEFFKLKDEYNKQKELVNYYENLKKDYNKQKELLNSYVNLKEEFNKQKELLNSYINLEDEFNKQKELLNSYESLKEDYNRQKELLNSYEGLKEEYNQQKELLNSYESLKEDYNKQKELLTHYENERKEYNKVRELLVQYENERKQAEAIKEDPLKISIRKKAKEKENIQIEEDKIKINEIKNRIQNYKDELRKGMGNIRMSCRVKLNKKNFFNLEQNVRDSNKKKTNKIEEEKKVNHNEIKELDENLYEDVDDNNNNNIGQTTINNQTNIDNNFDNNNINNNYNNKEGSFEMRDVNYVNNNTLINKNEEINNTINVEKKPNNLNVVTFNEPEKKEKKDKTSRALDRFKKRYKKDNNPQQDYKSKKSQKINEIAKRLENVMGKSQSAEMRDKKEEEPEVFREGKTAEILQSQTLSAKKVKKPHRPKI